MRRVLLGLLALWAGMCQAQYAEEEVKAAFLYNFARFVEWPAAHAPGAELVVAVVGADAVEEQLQRIAADRTRDRRMQVRSLAPGAPLAGVHILYVGADEPGRLEKLVGEARRQHILVVSDTPNGLARGAVINFVTNDRVRFEVSLKAAEDAGLRLSSRLLSVAMRIRKGEGPSDPLLRLHA